LPAPAVDINLKVRSKSPRHVVERAIELSASSDFDQAWCVFDVDSFSTDDAIVLASDRGIRLAVSNPCFELWLLLHFEERTSHVDDYRAAARSLRKHVAVYDKTRLRFEDYQLGLSDAIDRARKLGDMGNPSTGMWRLAIQIMGEEEM
jgi:RloB-like protein